MLRTIALTSFALLASSACFTYQRSQEPAPVNAGVSLLLSTEGQLRLRDRIGLDVRELRGRLLEDDGTTLLVEVPSTGPMVGVGGSQLYQRIDVPRADILEMRVRSISPARTVALTAVAAGAGAGLILATVLAEENPGNAPPDPPGPQDRRVPWIPRLPIIP